MTTSKDLSPLNFLAFNAKGHRYLRAYKNEWVSKRVTGTARGHSRTKEQHHAGSMIDNYRVRLSPKFLHRFPQFEGYEWFYENNLLKDKDTFLAEHPDYVDPLAAAADEELPGYGGDSGASAWTKKDEDALANETAEEEFPTPSTLSFLPAYAVLAMARDQGYEMALAEVFGKKAASAWLTAMTYRLCDAGPAQCISDWLAEQYLGGKSKLSSQRLSELYASCNQEKFDQFWVERFKHSQQANKGAAGGIRYCAFDSTSIGTYSASIADAAYGHSKQDEGIPQINLAIVMDQATGEIIYAHAYEGSINDKATYSFIFEKMVQAGFPMDQVILVTDRGYPSNEALSQMMQEGSHFLTAYPIAKNSSLEKWAVGHVDLMESASVTNPGLRLGVHTQQEKWKVGQIEKTVYVHYYYDASVAGDTRKELNTMVAMAVDLLNKGQRIDDDLMKIVKPYIKKKQVSDSSPHMKPVIRWVINNEELKRALDRAGYHVLKTDCLADPVEAHRLYSLRQEIEQGFDQLKTAINGRRLRVAENSYRGRLLEYLLAVSIRCQILHRKAAHRQAFPCSKVKMPGDSIDKMLRQLDRFKLRRAQSNRRWQLDMLPAKVVAWLKVFFAVKAPPRNCW